MIGLRYILLILAFVLQLFPTIEQTSYSKVRFTSESGQEPYQAGTSTNNCFLQQADYHYLVGIQGESILSGNSHISFSKYRSRTSLMRRMLQHSHSCFIVYNCIKRRESAPFCIAVGSTYYVYALRHILC